MLYKIFVIYKIGFKCSFASMAAYRLNFFISFIITLISNLLIPLVTILIYNSGAQIPGWSFYEAMLIQSVFMLCTGVSTPLFYNLVWETMGRVRDGSYDILLLKPIPVILLTATSFDLENIGVILSAIALFVISLLNLPAVGLLSWFAFLFLFIMGILVLYGIICIMAASAFKWVGNSRIFEMFSSVTVFGRYPATIFPKAMINVLLYVFPVAMIGFYPASALLGMVKSDIFIAAIPCAGICLFGILLFQKMVKGYQSAGG